MRIQIQNFRGLSDLDATVAPILLLAGSNAAGKSSACVAIGAVASGSLLPFDGMTKKAAQLLVHDGCERANAVITTDEGNAAAAWPAVERATQGRFRDSSAVAVGLEDITAMKAAERAGRLIDLIGANPTEKDLTDALLELPGSADFVGEVWKQIAKGWDAAHLHYKEEGAKLKGQWEKLTGERFGSSKALTWRPKAWLIHLEAASTDALQVAIVEAEEALDGVKRRAGADQATIEGLRNEAEKLPAAQRTLKETKADLEQQQLVVLRTAKVLRDLGVKPKAGEVPLRCPCCEKTLQLVNGKLLAATLIDAAEHRDSLIAEFEAAESAAVKAVETRDMAQKYVASAEHKVKVAQEAADKLKTAPQGDATAEDLGLAQDVLDTKKLHAAMKQAVIDSMALVERIQRRATIVGALDKDGVRQTVLVARLGEFNGRLVDNSRTAKWSPVHIDADMAISYGGRPLSLCSAGEQFRARVTLQLTIAQTEEAPLVVIDGADILDRAGRNGLLGLVSGLAIPTVIGMTIMRKEDMPDLARAGIGNSVWIEGGSAEGALKVAA